MTSSDPFDKDYFEDGIRKRKSLYENYRWMPEVSFPLANSVKRMYPGKSVLDYGCGKGYLVHALRLLNVTAYGYDISDYALENCKDEVTPYLFRWKAHVPQIDVVFAKDALEHNFHEEIDAELKWLAGLCKEACMIVPLGENGRYRIKDYNFDETHIIAENEEWWAKKFVKAGFSIKAFYHRLFSFKQNWLTHSDIGNGIYLLESHE